MLKKGEHVEGIPSELQHLLDGNQQANDFFLTLSKSGKQAYCDWIGSAKQEVTRQSRAEKALLMLQKQTENLENRQVRMECNRHLPRILIFLMVRQ